MPNNRELAVLLWLGVAGIWLVPRRSVRASLVSVLRSLVGPKIAIPIAAMGVWVGALVFVGMRIGLWDLPEAKCTALWFCFTAVPLLVNVNDTPKAGFFRRAVLANLRATVFIEFFVNLFVFPLPVELGLVPLTALLAGMSVVASRDESYASVRKLVDTLLSGMGIVTLAYASFRVADGWREALSADTFRNLALPIWMTPGVLLFVYLFGLVTFYELIFTTMRMSRGDQPTSWRSRAAVLGALNVRLDRVTAFAGIWPSRVGEQGSFTGARGVIHEYLAGR